MASLVAEVLQRYRAVVEMVVNIITLSFKVSPLHTSAGCSKE